MNKTKGKNLNRRQFLGNTARMLGTAIAFPTIISSKVLGGRGGVPASDKIVFGAIGCANQGWNDVTQIMQHDDVVFVAFCNVHRPTREAKAQIIEERYGSCDTYIDFREFLARDDIDAVVSATGDRNHAMLSVHIMRAGKDNYSEKPGTMTIQEGQVLVETEKRYGRIYQGGAQRMCESNFIFANELVRLGRLGEVNMFIPELSNFGDTPYMRTTWDEANMEEPSYEEFWWDPWLGANPWMPYRSEFSSGSNMNVHRYYYYNGSIGEWGSHTFPQCMDAMETTHTGPVKFIFPNNETGEGMRLIFADGREMVPTKGIDYSSCAVRYEGSEGWVGVGDGGLGTSKSSLMSDYNKIVADYRERTGRRGDNKRDFLDCIKSRMQTTTHAEVVHRSMSAVQIANICMWLKRDLDWDPQKEEFINDEEANRLRSRAQREPWAFV